MRREISASGEASCPEPAAGALALEAGSLTWHDPGVDFAERAARNEEAFRAINSRIDEGAQQHAVDTPLPFHCECDQAGCVEKIELRPSVYEGVVAHRYRFVLVPGHEDPTVERVVERHDTHVVAEKIGEARAQIDADHPQRRHS